MPRRSPQHLVDRLRSQMSAEKLSEFDEYCRFCRSNTDIWRWLQQEGHTLSLTAVDNWRRSKFPDGEQTKVLNGLSESFANVQGDRSLELVLGLTTKLLHKIVEEHSDRATGLRTKEALALIPGLSREARAAARSLAELRYIQSKRELELAGAQRVCDILANWFKDTSFESALKDAAQGAMQQLESEI